MLYEDVKSTLQEALDNQTTISISKLKKLLQALNIGLESTESKEVKFLKKEVKNLHRHIRKLQKEKEAK